jgi:hypothetical protein
MSDTCVSSGSPAWLDDLHGSQRWTLNGTMKTQSFENFPWWIVIVCNAVGLGIYAIGLYLMACLGIAWAAGYAVYCLCMEWRILSGSCRSCCYYGKRCGFGRGRVCSWFFAKTERNLSEKRISWRDVVPDFLVSLIPLAVGVVVLVRNFSWLVLFLTVCLVILGSAGTGFIRARLACKYCKQRELGCPAEQLFNKTKPA